MLKKTLLIMPLINVSYLVANNASIASNAGGILTSSSNNEINLSLHDDSNGLNQTNDEISAESENKDIKSTNKELSANLNINNIIVQENNVDNGGKLLIQKITTEEPKENEDIPDDEITEDLTKNLNINEILRQKSSTENTQSKQIKIRTQSFVKNALKTEFSKKKAKLAKERRTVERLNALSVGEKEQKMRATHEQFSQSCQDFIHKSFTTGIVDLKDKSFFKTRTAPLCVFFGFDLAQIFRNEITFNTALEYYKDLPNFTNVLVDMNAVHRKLTSDTEKRKKIMIKKGFLKP